MGRLRNEVLLKLLQYRNNNNLSLETIRKDVNLLMKLLKIAFGESVEIVNKYKIIQMALSKMHEHKEQQLCYQCLQKLSQKLIK